MLQPTLCVFLPMSFDEHSVPEENEPDDPIAAAALDWFVRLRGEGIREEDRRMFERWRDADPAHADAFAEVEALWSDLDAVSPPLPLPHAWAEPSRVRKPARGRWRLWGTGAIAASFLAIGAPQLWIMAIADARTGIAERRALSLADGSHVTLDADSAIDVSIDADSRRIRLLRGRAWFEVAHEARPFTVAVGNAQVRDIGTAFDITKRGDGGDVAVTQGLVELTAAGGRALRLGRGGAARFSGAGRYDFVPPPPLPASWMKGRLQFVGMPVSDVLDDLARYGAGRPLILSDDVARRRITGSVDLAHPAAARDAILARASAQALRVGPWLFVTAR